MGRLEDLGWSPSFEEAFAPWRAKGFLPGRLIRDNKITFGAMVEGGEEHEVLLAGKVWHDAHTDAELPAVGDWVALDLGGELARNVIRARLPRHNTFSRKAPGKTTDEQVIAANVNAVLVVTDPGRDFNPRRLERYLFVIRKCTAEPIILLNKTDLHSPAEIEEALEAVRVIDPAVAVLPLCAHDPASLTDLRAFLAHGKTIALVGSSGVGKSTLANTLIGEDWQWTDSVNPRTGKGLHTTTARELIPLPGGGVLIDNPGIREIQMWTDERTLRESFADLYTLARQCRHSNCRHQGDEGCAIEAAVLRRELSPERHLAYLRLEDEIRTLSHKRKKRTLQLEKQHTRDRTDKKRPRPRFHASHFKDDS